MLFAKKDPLLELMEYVFIPVTLTSIAFTVWALSKQAGVEESILSHFDFAIGSFALTTFSVVVYWALKTFANSFPKRNKRLEYYANTIRVASAFFLIMGIILLTRTFLLKFLPIMILLFVLFGILIFILMIGQFLWDKFLKNIFIRKPPKKEPWQ